MGAETAKGAEKGAETAWGLKRGPRQRGDFDVGIPAAHGQQIIIRTNCHSYQQMLDMDGRIDLLLQAPNTLSVGPLVFPMEFMGCEINH